MWRDCEGGLWVWIWFNSIFLKVSLLFRIIKFVVVNMDELLVSIVFSKELCVVEIILVIFKYERLFVNVDILGK